MNILVSEIVSNGSRLGFSSAGCTRVFQQSVTCCRVDPSSNPNMGVSCILTKNCTVWGGLLKISH